MLILTDDTLAAVAPKHVDRMVQMFSEELEQDGCRLWPYKSAVYIPDAGESDGPATEITSVPQVWGGLLALGCAYGGAYETTIGLGEVAMEPGVKRLRGGKAGS